MESVLLRSYREQIEEALGKVSLGSHPTELYEPMSYALRVGGKRVRPLLVLLSYALFKREVKDILMPALSVELLHNFTLVHDDVMDLAPLRRGQPTLYRRWNTNIAILSGDAILIKGYELLSSTPKSELSKVLQAFNRCAIEVCEGQQFDLNYETQGKVLESEYMEMIRLKTGCLIGLCLELGAILGKASEAETRQMRQLGEEIGVIFQMNDDLLDAYGEYESFGKQMGGDIMANKKTLLSIRAWEQASSVQRKVLEKWQNMRGTDKLEEKVRAVREIYDELCLAEKMKQEIRHLNHKMLDKIERIGQRSEEKTEMISFLSSLLDRRH